MTTFDGIRLVARRELTERTREKSFLISTVVTLLILCGFIVIPKVFFSDRTPTWDIGLVGAAQLARPLETQAPLVGARVRLQRPANAAAAEAALRDGDLDLASTGASSWPSPTPTTSWSPWCRRPPGWPGRRPPWPRRG
jgi:ABC-2 type transport system permease protein